METNSFPYSFHCYLFIHISDGKSLVVDQLIVLVVPAVKFTDLFADLL